MPAKQEFRTSLAFPAKRDETWIVRDGHGRTVEEWTVRNVSDGKSHRYLDIEIDTLVPAEA